MLQQWHKPTAPGKCLELTSVNQFLKVVDIHDSNLLKNENRSFENASWCNDLINYGISSSNHSNRRASIQNVFHDHGYYTKQNLLNDFMDKLNKVSDIEIKNIEKSTRFQSLSKKWFTVRSSRITASMVHKVIGTSRNGNFATGYAKTHITSGKNNLLKNVPAIKWGVQNEKTALAEYVQVLGEPMEKCGIFIHKYFNHLAASPDAINENGNLIVEIKCPFKIRLGDPREASYLSKGCLAKNHEYYTQIQFQLFVTGVKVCDFVVWTTKGIYIEKIDYDKKFVETRLPFINEYYSKVFIPTYLKIKC